MKSKTKEEMFLLKLHELAAARGDVFTPVEPAIIGRQVFVTEKRIYNIIQQLTQANFTRKTEGLICLTSNGLRLVEELMES